MSLKKIGIISCFFRESITEEVRDHIQFCLRNDVEIQLEIVSPSEHKFKMTEEEKEDKSLYWPREYIRKVFDVMNKTVDLILLSGPVHFDNIGGYLYDADYHVKIIRDARALGDFFESDFDANVFMEKKQKLLDIIKESKKTL